MSKSGGIMEALGIDMKNILAILFLTVAISASSQTKYVGRFVGDGTAVSNVQAAVVANRVANGQWTVNTNVNLGLSFNNIALGGSLTLGTNGVMDWTVPPGTFNVTTVNATTLLMATNAFASGYALDFNKTVLALATNNTLPLAAAINWNPTNLNQIMVVVTNTSATPFPVTVPATFQYLPGGGTPPYCTNVWTGIFYSTSGTGTNYFSSSR